MRLSLRFLVPLLVALAAFAYAAVPFVDGMMQRWFVRDLDERSALIAYTVEEPLRQLLADSTPSRITAFFNRLTQDQQLYAVAYCPAGAAKRCYDDCSNPSGIRSQRRITRSMSTSRIGGRAGTSP